tara:strand:- start:598 stop:1023 length:426 start_codon:yes stop_codon:yes gene_type:complete
MMVIRLILTCLVLIALPFQAMACSCTPDNFTEAASIKHIAAATLIFKGTALNAKNAIGAKYFSEVNFQVDTVYKGTETRKTVMAYVDTRTSCGIAPSELKNKRLFMFYDIKREYVLAAQCGDYISDADKAALQRGDYLLNK